MEVPPRGAGGLGGAGQCLLDVTGRSDTNPTWVGGSIGVISPRMEVCTRQGNRILRLFVGHSRK